MIQNRHLFAAAALEKLLVTKGVRTVLDVGSGPGYHAAVMRSAGKEVTTISLIPPADYVGDYLRYAGPRVDAIWASHVLEHQLNVNFFLRKCFSDLRDNGVLAVTVPPLKHEVVGGHINLFNMGTLLYNLILAGFDCSRAAVSECYVAGPLDIPYNLSVLVRKKQAKLPKLVMDAGDVETLAPFWPFAALQGFNGQMGGINWERDL